MRADQTSDTRLGDLQRHSGAAKRNPEPMIMHLILERPVEAAHLVMGSGFAGQPAPRNDGEFA
jgi:hypothetical protein